MRTLDDRIERNDRRSSGHRKISESRMATFSLFKSRENGYFEHNVNNIKHYNHKNFFDKKSDRHSHRHKSRRSHQSSRESINEIKNDEKGHLIFKPGDVINHRYKVISLLGEGTFGRCLKCLDKKRSEEIALKVIRNVQKYRDSAFLEIEVLEAIQKDCTALATLCINILKSFKYGGHVCIAFPCLGKSVYDFLVFNDFQPFTFNQIKHIGYQLISALKFLHSLNLTHTDLKPENLLFVNSDYEVWETPNSSTKYKNILNTDIRIIDFGSATFDNEHHSRVVCTRHYRPPEVILELGWDHSCDMWSAGCIIFELYKGTPMFMTHDNLEHLVMMELILGPIPTDMIRKTSKDKYFYHEKLLQFGKRIDERYIVKNCCPLKSSFVCKDENHYQVYDLVQKLLTYSPKKRITAADAVNHSLFSKLFCTFKPV